MSVKFRFETNEEENYIEASFFDEDRDELINLVRETGKTNLKLFDGFRDLHLNWGMALARTWKGGDGGGFKDVVFKLVSLASRPDFPLQAFVCLTEAGKNSRLFREVGFPDAATELWLALVFREGPVALGDTLQALHLSSYKYLGALYEMILAEQIDLDFCKR